MKPDTHRARRRLIRVALLLAVAQVLAVAGFVFTLSPVREQPVLAVLLALLGLFDLVLLAVFAGWILQGSIGAPVARLAADVQRIAAGDYHHRVGETQRGELREIRESVNRLADRLIADQRRLARNIQSLEETNRELVLLRDQMIHSARLASVGTLAAGIAHEIGNPLTAVTAFVDVAKSRAARAGADTEILDAIRGEADRIDRIVKGLLGYARPQTGGGEPARAREVLVGVRDLLERQGRLERVDTVWELGDETTGMVMEPHRLEQVLVNLLLNALDAVEGTPGARITVRLYGEEGEVRRLPVRREGDPPGINYMHRRRSSDESVADFLARAAHVTVIEVSDNGPGIAPDHLPHIFDPFFTTKEPGKGTGLGLSICARLVEGMGGQIDAGASTDGGARFVIRLPGVIGQDSLTVVPSVRGATEKP